MLFSQHGYIVNELCDWKGVVYEMITAVLIFYIQNSTTLLCCVPFYYFLCSGEEKKQPYIMQDYCLKRFSHLN